MLCFLPVKRSNFLWDTFSMTNSNTSLNPLSWWIIAWWDGWVDGHWSSETSIPTHQNPRNFKIFVGLETMKELRIEMRWPSKSEQHSKEPYWEIYTTQAKAKPNRRFSHKYGTTRKNQITENLVQHLLFSFRKSEKSNLKFSYILSTSGVSYNIFMDTIIFLPLFPFPLA